MSLPWKGRFSLIFFLGLLCALVVWSGAVRGQTAPLRAPKAGKPAWEWTLDERLAQRYDPNEIRSRAAAKAAEDAKIQEMFKDLPGGSGTERDSRTDTIEGRTHPELFLTWELFDALLGDAFPSGGLHPSESRRHLEAPAAALGFGRDFWVRLERVAAPYLELQHENEQLAHQEVQTKTSDRRDPGTSLCRARERAISAAKAEFGEQRFLQFLYQAVAPNLALSYVPEERPAGRLRFVEGGCR
jgi:hypothetical protein